jgi:peptidoglycan hydrolase-like protein with peptidoglycan-binding domain
MKSEDTFDASFVTSTPELAGLLNDLCLAAPEQQLEMAARSLLEAVEPARVRSNSDLVRVGLGAQQVVLRSETMRLIQQRLAEQGYYRGAIDGEYGPQLAVALRRYQQANDLEASAIPDSRTVFHLLLDLTR